MKISDKQELVSDNKKVLDGDNFEAKKRRRCNSNGDMYAEFDLKDDHLLEVSQLIERLER